jgi:hypothetical protein
MFSPTFISTKEWLMKKVSITITLSLLILQAAPSQNFDFYLGGGLSP